MSQRWRTGRFNEPDDDPLGPLANLVDVVLVFACGLMAALVAHSDLLAPPTTGQRPQPVTQGQELPQLPASLQSGQGEGLESLGQVYRDPETGKLILIGQ